MKTNPPLPKGQREIDSFPRFGLIPFATRFPAVVGAATLRIGGDVKTPVEVGTSVKHLERIEFWRSDAAYRPIWFRFMDHPRARVAHEERGRWVPGWVLRYLYRPLIRPTAAHFERAMREYESRANRQGAP
jgi:DMSO/TMAO reductase YedYZ molybdopterin-dependent catalytic subunit